jgi:hypothetical protein
LPLQSLKARARPEKYQEDVNEKGLSDYSDPVAVVGVGGCTEQFVAVHNTGYELAIAKFAEYNQLADHYHAQQLDTEHLTLEHLAVEFISVKFFAIGQLNPEYFTVGQLDTEHLAVQHYPFRPNQPDA